jgi:hypothetical protein
LTCPAALAQEGTRDLTAAQNSKFLTANQLDRWLFEGEKGEVVIAHVASKDFDPVLGLARTAAKDDKPLLEADDPGSESRFAFRLPEKGKFEIRVNAFKFQGGGNYTLRVQRFQASPLAVGKPLVGTLDREGKGYHYFAGVKDRVLVPEVKGASSEAWKTLDSKGRETKGWGGTALVEEDGEGYVLVSGPPNQRYDLLVREARRHDLAEGTEQPGALPQGEAGVWSFTGKPGDFRLIEVEKTGDLHARLVFAPLDKAAEQRLTRENRPEVEFLPVASRGGKLRFAAILGREGRYQLQLVAGSASTFTLTARDPSLPLAVGKDEGGDLPVGGAVFYRFQATAGQLLQTALTSRKFVPLLRLYDARGALVASSGDDPDSPTARITHMVLTGGTYRLQVASVGDGGGGEFRQELKEAAVEELKLGDRGKGTLAPGATDFRAFEGKEGQTVFLSVRSAFDPAVSLRGPDGVPLAADNRGNAATGSLLAIKLPKAGRYVVWIASRRGAGEYSVRLIDGD